MASQDDEDAASSRGPKIWNFPSVTSATGGAAAGRTAGRRKPSDEASSVSSESLQKTARSLHEVICEAAPGDCIYLAPGTYEISEPLLIDKTLFLIGFDDADGRCVEIVFRAGPLLPVVPMLRSTAARAVVAHVNFRFEHDEERAAASRAAVAFAVEVASGTCELQNCLVRSSASGVKVKLDGTCIVSSAKISAVDVGIALSGGTAVLSASTLTTCAVGIDVAHKVSEVNVSDCSICDCQVGVKAAGVTTLLNADFTGCIIGVSVEPEHASTQVDAVRITASLFTNCTRGVFIAAEAVVQKCRFERCQTAGITIEDGSPKLHGCTVTECPMGIEILGGRAALDTCLVSHCRDVGVIVSGMLTQPSLQRCVIMHTTHDDGSAEKTSASLRGATLSLISSDDANALPTHAAIALAIEEGAAPHVESCNFSKNDVHVWSVAGCGTITASVFTEAEFDAMIIAGEGADVAVTHNHVTGSARGAGLSFLSLAKGFVKRNTLARIQLAAICLRSSGFTEVCSNTMEECQDALVVIGPSRGEAARNLTALRTIIFSDAVDSFTVREDPNSSSVAS